MSIINILDDLRSFFATLFAGERIDVLFPGTFFIFSIAIILTFWIVFGKIKKMSFIKIMLIIFGNCEYLYYFTLKHLPIEFLKSDIEVIKRDGMIFGQFWYPFFQIDSLSLIIKLYLNDFIFLFVFGFISTICYKDLIKLYRFILYNIGVIIFEIIFVLFNNLFHQGLCDTYDLSLIVIESLAMIMGYALAKIIINLNIGIYNKIHATKSPTKIEASII